MHHSPLLLIAGTTCVVGGTRVSETTDVSRFASTVGAACAVGAASDATVNMPGLSFSRSGSESGVHYNRHNNNRELRCSKQKSYRADITMAD